MHIGVVVNPIAGMGGRVGLKGTDGKVAEARERGASPRSPDRARRMLTRLVEHDASIRVSTAGDPMGESLVRVAGLDPEVVYEPAGDPPAANDGTLDGGPSDDGAPNDGAPNDGTTEDDTRYAQALTSDDDTTAAVEALQEAGVDLVLFVGGDGTAADVATALEGTGIPMLGVPAGVKVYSSVFAVSPEDAADVAVTFDRTERREVMDIDEDDYREGEVSPELRAVASVPVADALQSSKQLGGGTVEALAEGIARDVDPGVTYVLGPGSTVGAIKAELGFDPSPIGVDVWRDGEVLVRDATESEILEALGEENVIVVSPIGGQGFVFGRGNPQLSPAVIRRCDVSIVASRSKLDELSVLRVDTDDPELDAELRGWTRVRIGAFETRMIEIV
ncbi:Predicted polyphosphate-or ATP-dependent NAD kinase [Halopenitus malekzadehii]|uniref:Predicted polyphosphate-or ATP-dependent NAD kinase n=1 Tax=Halopenitus malekzadehii TaxID=1267564 RepID=A0A1H6JR14_9EURY|nr:ATP-NAD kinase family protein [Halopenitus malekzadehii]SEH64939.1 Predicted polyphosphate-or ATP-dependent NAD kinase [Halopenitus malekzadehii]